MAQVRVEFTVEPFREGKIGAHVEAALDAFRDDGFEPDVGPFGTTVEGETEAVLRAFAGAATAAFGSGATGISLTARSVIEAAGAEQFLAAVRPVARALGALVVGPERLSDGAIPLVWQGQVVGGLERPQPSDLRNGLATLVTQIEAELGGTLVELDRGDKQRAVRLLDERGAFAIRNAVDEVADAMGVSRVTVYNYLNATRAAPDA